MNLTRIIANRSSLLIASRSITTTTTTTTTTTKRMSKNLVNKVPPQTLFVSEPDPFMFGNDDNEEDNPHWTNKNWLKSRFHFAFAEWSSPITNFGVLRVLNDDLVQPNRGFGTHGHADMEIATLVLEGELTHKDSTGNQETLGRGSVQYMSAGQGVRHSERNNSPTDPLRFLQMWILPRRSGGKPKYGGYAGTTPEAEQGRRNKWAHLVTAIENTKDTTIPIKLDQDVNIYIAEMVDDESLDFQIHPGRQAYVVNAEGNTKLLTSSSSNNNDIVLTLGPGDAAECYGGVHLKFEPADHLQKCFWVIVEMKWTGGKSHVV